MRRVEGIRFFDIFMNYFNFMQYFYASFDIPLVNLYIAIFRYILTQFKLKLNTIIIAYQIVWILEDNLWPYFEHGAYFIAAVFAYSFTDLETVCVIIAIDDILWEIVVF